MSKPAVKETESEVPVEKPSPYPFRTKVEGLERSYEAMALKLVMHGLLIEVREGVLGIGEKAVIKFDLPADIGYIESQVSVVKTYDRQVPSKEGIRVQRIVEVHFTSPLKDKSKSMVKRFLKGAKQFGSDLV